MADYLLHSPTYLNTCAVRNLFQVATKHKLMLMQRYLAACISISFCTIATGNRFLAAQVFYIGGTVDEIFLS